ncbi:MAG: hypothetical protein KKB37_08820 [Alphaproteobacteria bacterium]|nr:hypothetical protein [Alphaproteobacteria bacterium]
MSPNLVGALIGFIVGFLGFVFIRLMAKRTEEKGVGPDPARTASMLRAIALFDFIFFIIAGYFIGPMIVSNPA